MAPAERSARLAGAARAGSADLELPFPRLAGDCIEHGVHEPRLVLVVEAVRDVDILGDGDARRHVLAEHELVGAGPEDRAQHRFDPLQWPALGQDLVDLAVDGALLGDDARQHGAKEGALGRLEGDPLDLLPDPVGLEFGERVDHALAGEVHLVERLDGSEAGGAALRGLCHRCQPTAARRRAARSTVRGASAAPPPWFSSPTRARRQAWASVSTVTMPLPSGRRRATDRSISARALSPATISKWKVSPRMTQPSATAAS